MAMLAERMGANLIAERARSPLARNEAKKVGVGRFYRLVEWGRAWSKWDRVVTGFGCSGACGSAAQFIRQQNQSRKVS